MHSVIIDIAIFQWHSLNVAYPVISVKTRDFLNEFISFRHVFRNVYGFNLIAERLEHLLNIFTITVDSLKSDIVNFIKEMEDIML